MLLGEFVEVLVDDGDGVLKVFPVAKGVILFCFL
jgi:hypothetical protein